MVQERQSGTAVGTFMSPKTFLKNGDVVEVEILEIGILKYMIVFD